MFGYVDALLRYFEVSGRSTRTQYFVFQITLVVVLIAAIYLDYRISGRPPSREALGFLTLFVIFFHAVPGVTVTVRRLHDSGRSGWWYLIGFVPIIGGIWLLVLMFLGPTPEAVAYGEDPRYGSGASVARGEASPAQQLLARMEARRLR